MNGETLISDERFRLSFEKVQRKLKQLLQRKPKLAVGLQIALESASKQAKTILREDIYNAIDEEFNLKGWPKSIKEWSGILDHPKDGNEFLTDANGDPDCFLWLSATWLPNEEGSVWKGNNGYNEKLLHMI